MFQQLLSHTLHHSAVLRPISALRAGRGSGMMMPHPPCHVSQGTSSGACGAVQGLTWVTCSQAHERLARKTTPGAPYTFSREGTGEEG